RDPAPDPKTGELPYRVDGSGNRGIRVDPHRTVERTRTINVPAEYEDGFDLGPLQALVRLPGLRDGETFWGEANALRVTFKEGGAIVRGPGV
ncbi:hypothetical protein JNW90_23700, partial [Micromonospora sp. STR1s_5]|nr:hypothetical protein [Micromonospora sp. STR1s_5]